MISSYLKSANFWQDHTRPLLSVANNLNDGLELAARIQPSIALLELALAKGPAAESIQALRVAAPEMGILMLANPDSEVEAMEALEAGAQDYLLLGHFDPNGLRRAIHNIQIRRRLEQKTALNEARFQDFAAASADWWFWEMDADLRFSYFSANAISAIGRPIESMLGKRREELSAAPIAEMPTSWATHLEDLQCRRPFHQFEYRALLPDGFYGRFSQQLRQTCKRQGADFLDLGASADFHHSDFWDTTHLNHSGGHKLVKHLIPYLSPDIRHDRGF